MPSGNFYQKIISSKKENSFCSFHLKNEKVRNALFCKFSFRDSHTTKNFDP